MDILSYSATELADAIRDGKTTVADAAKAVLSKIDAEQKEINAYITVDTEAVLKKSDDIQKKIEAGELKGKLAGVPIAVKDNICTKGIRTTCASKILENFVPNYSAEVIDKLEKAGALIIGKTNMDEFAMGHTNETSAFGMVKNPLNKEYVPGGSSGGSAAALSSKQCFLSLGSDTGGSIRQPAAFCGLVGLKPTYGTVSRYGLVAFASSLDQIGPLTKNVTDCAATMDVISGYDVKDSTSIKRTDIDNTCFSSALVNNVKGMKIGIPQDYFTEGLSEEVKHAILSAAKVFEEKGAIVEKFNLTLVKYAVPAYYTIACAEASSNLERYDGVKYGYRTEEYSGLHNMYKKTRSEGFGEEVKRRIMLGSFVLSAGYYDEYYLKALKVKSMIKNAFDKALKKYDLILGPVSPDVVPKLGDSNDDPLKKYLSDIYTVSANLAGIPAISIPCGKDSNGMPIGLQLMANCFEERKLIQAAYAYEKSGVSFPK